MLANFYFWGMLFVIPIWAVVFFKVDKSIKQKMIISGIGFGALAYIIGNFYSLRDYWHPIYLVSNFHLEDFMYGFFEAGAICGFVPLIFKTKIVGKIKINYFLLFIYIIFLLLAFIVLTNVLKLNSILPLTIVPIFVGVVSHLYMKDKIYRYIIGGIVAVLQTMLIYQIILLIYPNAIINSFELDKLFGVIVFGVPIEEILFAFALGFGCTSAYESVLGLKQIDK